MTTITKEQINYIKRCDTILFRHTSKNKSTIELIKRANPKDAFSLDKRVTIEVDDNLNETYEAYTGANNYYSAQTPLTLLRANDQIRLYWSANHFELTDWYDKNCMEHLFLHVNRGKQNIQIPIRTEYHNNPKFRMIRKVN